MAAYGLTDGSSVVSLNPEYDFKMDGRKVENNHRTRGGKLYKYTWGSFDRVKFGAEHLTSADMCTVNSWWSANTPLILYDANSAAVISGYLVNPSKPIDQFIQPYNDAYKGVIELEGY
jgi:hypothetical protein